MSRKTSKPALPPKPTDPAGILFDRYSLSYQLPAQKAVHWVCMLLIVFSLLGITWALPFPHLSFLAKYNGFFNWSSFLIAIAVYYYYKKMPMLSFVVFFMFFVFTYGIMNLADWQKAGGPSLLLISTIIFVAAAFLQFYNLKLTNKRASLTDGFQFLILSPIWLLHFLFRKK